MNTMSIIIFKILPLILLVGTSSAFSILQGRTVSTQFRMTRSNTKGRRIQWNSGRIPSSTSFLTSTQIYVYPPKNCYDSKRISNNPSSRPNNRTRRTTRTLITSFLLYISLLLKTSTIAHANHPLENIPTSNNARISLRPGITVEEMKQELELRQELTVQELAKLGTTIPTATTASSSSSSSSSSSHSQKEHDLTAKAKKKSTTLEFSSKDDEEEEYENMDFLEEEGEYDEHKGKNKSTTILHSTTDTTSTAMDLSSQSNVVKTVTKFSGSAPIMSSQTKNKQVAKTVVKIMGPIFAFCFVRETIRWNREQKNVEKGLEIMKQQQKEYLNSKKEGEEDEEDDDDDDDDEEEEEDDDDEK